MTSRNAGVVLLLMLAVPLGGCSTLKAVDRGVEAELGLGGEAADRLAIPVEQMRVRIGRGVPGRMVLARIERGVEHWLAFDGFSIWMKEGRIHGTNGLRSDLVNMHALESSMDPIAFALGDEAAAEKHDEGVFYAQSDDAPLGIILKTSMRRAPEPSPVSLGGQTFRLLKVSEEWKSLGAEQASWTNEYWVEPSTGRVLITRQRLPGSDYVIRMEFMPEKEDP
jgi:hypothetical protein